MSYFFRILFRARRELNALATSSRASTGAAIGPRPYIKRIRVPVRISRHKLGKIPGSGGGGGGGGMVRRGRGARRGDCPSGGRSVIVATAGVELVGVEDVGMGGGGRVRVGLGFLRCGCGEKLHDLGGCCQQIHAGCMFLNIRGMLNKREMTSIDLR